MAIELAPIVAVTKHESYGHMGLQTAYVVEVRIGEAKFYPMWHLAYGSPLCSLAEATKRSTQVADMLGFDVIHDYR